MTGRNSHYADDDSCQLKEVTHTYVEGGYKARQAFEYDADGHMLNDEQGQRLNYNSQGRLLSVKDADNEQTLSTYRYDGHNHLIGVREGLQEETLRNYGVQPEPHPPGQRPTPSTCSMATCHWPNSSCTPTTARCC